MFVLLRFFLAVQFDYLKTEVKQNQTLFCFVCINLIKSTTEKCI